MGSTVAPKMFSQPGVFGTSDATAVVNKTNPMAGLAATSPAAATQPSTVAMLDQAQNPVAAAATPAPAPVTNPTLLARPNLQIGFMRNRMMGPAFYGE